MPTCGENSVVHNDTGTSLMALTFSVILPAQVIASRTLPGASRPLRLNKYGIVLISLAGVGRMSDAGIMRTRLLQPRVTRGHPSFSHSCVNTCVHARVRKAHRRRQTPTG